MLWIAIILRYLVLFCLSLPVFSYPRYHRKNKASANYGICFLVWILSSNVFFGLFPYQYYQLIPFDLWLLFYQKFDHCAPPAKL